MLSKVYKELMILGFIAFAVILFKELGWIHWNTATLHCFEFCDLLVSICVLIYVGNTAMSSFTMHITQREWDRMSMTPTAAVIEDVTYYLDGLQTSGCKRFKHCLPLVATEWRAEADFKIMQLLFKTKFHMPAHFDYVMYIKAILEENVVSMANISTWHWVLIMLMNVRSPRNSAVAFGLRPFPDRLPVITGCVVGWYRVGNAGGGDASDG